MVPRAGGVRVTPSNGALARARSIELRRGAERAGHRRVVSRERRVHGLDIFDRRGRKAERIVAFLVRANHEEVAGRFSAVISGQWARETQRGHELDRRVLLARRRAVVDLTAACCRAREHASPKDRRRSTRVRRVHFGETHADEWLVRPLFVAKSAREFSSPRNANASRRLVVRKTLYSSTIFASSRLSGTSQSSAMMT